MEMPSDCPPVASQSSGRLFVRLMLSDLERSLGSDPDQGLRCFLHVRRHLQTDDFFIDQDSQHEIQVQR
jgi:hypothetical protein